ncbi:hypothetical protein GQ457_08G004190 [Hibiscus cannabinus]
MDLADWFRSNLSQQAMVAWAKDGWSINVRHQSSWLRPVLGWVKGNIDGVVDLHSDYASSLDRCSVLMVEMWTVHDMLKHTWSLGYRQMEVKTDISEVYAIVSGKSIVLHGNFVIQVVATSETLYATSSPNVHELITADK